MTETVREWSDDYETRVYRYNTDPEFRTRIDQLVEATLTDDVLFFHVRPIMAEVAHEYWLHGEVHLFNRMDDAGEFGFLRGDRVVIRGGRVLYLIDARQAEIVRDLFRREVVTEGDGFAMVIENEEYFFIRRTGPGENPASEFQKDLEEAGW